MLRFRKYSSHIRSFSKQINSLIDVNPEIEHALKKNQPIVALESTIITHGMPYPQNIQTAFEVEKEVREEGAIPATIAIINGRIKVGLNKEQFENLAKTSETPTVKTSRRDLAYVLSKKLNGGTTVSGTIIIANAIGIDIFATGGIGGVHRGFEKNLDISADLIELGRTSCTVVASGVKSILDIPKTLEFLETQGVTVATYQTHDRNFPAFYSRKSDCIVPYNLNDPNEAADLINTAKKLNLHSSILIAVPVPEESEMNKAEIDVAIMNALKAANSNGISGKEITPFLLNAIKNSTGNKSLETNMALIKNNARVAAQISVQLSKFQGNNDVTNNTHPTLSHKTPVVIGGSILDICWTIDDCSMKLDGATYNISKFKNSGGGVGRNIAEGLSKLHGHVEFITKIGCDKNGEYLSSLLPLCCQRGTESDANQSTATCAIILDGTGDSKLILANMDIHKSIDSTMIKKFENVIKCAPVIIFDSNISIDAIGTILELCKKYNKPAFYEPTDMHIAAKPFSLPHQLIKQIRFTSPNLKELNAITTHLGIGNFLEENECDIDNLFKTRSSFIQSIKSASSQLTNYIDNVITTCGSNGILLSTCKGNNITFFDSNLQYNKKPSTEVLHKLYSVDNVINVVNVSGAGDSFNVGFIAAMINNCSEDICISVGMESAKAALTSPSAVPEQYFAIDHECWRRSAIYKTI